MSPLLEAALAYASHGWSVFPCHPRSKIPATPHGFKDATTDRKQIVYWWTQSPELNVAIATGEISNLFVLDIDEKPGRTLDEAIQSLPDIPTCPTVRTGGGGLQFFVGFPTGHDISISGGRLGRGIDTRGNGGYVVAPPSIHPHGTEYQWIDSSELTELPPCPQWIVERLEKQRAGVAVLAAEKLSGGRHDTLMTAAALMRGIGLVPTEIRAALEQMVSRLDLSDGRVIPPDEIARIANWCGDKSMGTVNIESVQHGEAVARSLLSSHGPAAAEMACLDDSDPQDPGAFPDELLRVPGLIEQMMSYIDAKSFRKQPVLALAATLTACGALIGRRYQTDSRGRANIYSIGLCDTGRGKEAARSAIKELLHAAGADKLLGPEDFASEAGIVSTLVQEPVQLYQIDEIGKLLAAITDTRASPHLAGIVGVLLKLYSSAASIYKGKAYSDAKKNPVIDQPHVCLYGTAVPDQAWAALGAGAAEDGLMGRLWVWSTPSDKPARSSPGIVAMPVALVDAIRTWVQSRPSALASVHPGEPTVVAKTEDATRIFENHADEVDILEKQLGNNPLRSLWTRCYQKADQLALIYAWSRDMGNPIIDTTCATWACQLALYLTRSMIFHANRHLSANGTEGATKKVLRMIEDTGELGLTRSALCRKTQWLPKRQREEIIEGLTESGQVTWLNIPGATKGTVRIWTRKHAPQGLNASEASA